MVLSYLWFFRRQNKFISYIWIKLYFIYKLYRLNYRGKWLIWWTYEFFAAPQTDVIIFSHNSLLNPLINYKNFFQKCSSRLFWLWITLLTLDLQFVCFARIWIYELNYLFLSKLWFWENWKSFFTYNLKVGSTNMRNSQIRSKSKLFLTAGALLIIFIKKFYKPWK